MYRGYLFLLYCLCIFIVSCDSDKRKKEEECINFILVKEKAVDTISQYVILFPFKFKGDTNSFEFQFDIGAPVTILYENYLKHIYPPLKIIPDIPPYKKCSIEGFLGGEYLWKDTCIIYKLNNVGDNDFNKVIGTIGLDFFNNLQRVLIDFPNRKICINYETNNTFTHSIIDSFFIRRNKYDIKLFIPIKINDTLYDNFFFDTGYGIGDVYTTYKNWQKWTGRKGDESDNIKVSVPSWGNEINLIGAYTKENVSIKIGGYHFKNLLVFTEAPGNKNMDLESFGFKVDGIIGTTLLINRNLSIFLDMDKKQFYIQ